MIGICRPFAPSSLHKRIRFRQNTIFLYRARNSLRLSLPKAAVPFIHSDLGARRLLHYPRREVAS